MDSSAATDGEILHDFPPFMRIYKSGRVDRLRGTDIVPPPTDNPGLLSKDTLISSDPSLSARLFLPSALPPQPKKLPLLIYIHGGAFVIQSPFSSSYTTHLSILTTHVNSLSISLQYRRAPEHPLPAAYDDVWSSMHWILSHRNRNGPEPWLNDYADFDRVFLAGASAGANLANDVAVRAGIEGLELGSSAPGNLKIEGLILVHPFFGLDDKIDQFMKFLFPTIKEGGNEARVDPRKDLGRLARLGCKRVAVFVAEKDALKEGGVGYCEALKTSGWEGQVELVETPGEDHVFYMYDHVSEKATQLVDRVARFVNRGRFN